MTRISDWQFERRANVATRGSNAAADCLTARIAFLKAAAEEADGKASALEHDLAGLREDAATIREEISQCEAARKLMYGM